MEATKFLENQHREVEALFEKIEKLGDGGGREKKALFAELAEKIETHAKLEEKLFYPEGEEIDEDTTLEAYEEHDVVRSLIRKIKRTSVSDDSFMAKITVLKELIEHHVEEEEGEYFPKCRNEMGEVKLRELGEKLEMMNEKLMGKAQPRRPMKRAA